MSSYSDRLKRNIARMLPQYTDDPTVAAATGLKMRAGNGELVAKMVLNPRQLPNPMDAVGRDVLTSEDNARWLRETKRSRDRELAEREAERMGAR